MHADYVPNPLYDNNPFIEALPPMLSGKDLIRALAVIPPYSDSDRDRSTGERLQLLSSLYEFYQPLSMTIDLYCEIYTAMQHCYGQYSIQSEAAAIHFSRITRDFSLRSVSVPPMLTLSMAIQQPYTGWVFHKPTGIIAPQCAIAPSAIKRTCNYMVSLIGIAATNCRICRFAPNIAAGLSIPMSHTTAHGSRNYFLQHLLSSVGS